MTTNLPALVTEVSRVIRSDDMQRQFDSMLPPSVKPDRFTEVTIAAIQNAPEVLEADRDSLYRACVAAARRGLLPDKREGALVAFNTNVGTRDQPKWLKICQFMPMVEGIIKEMAKAGIKAYAVSVYEEDAVTLWNDDDGQHVRHEPVMFGERGKLVGVFAAARTPDGRPYVEAMSEADVMKIAARSKQCKTDHNGNLILGGTWRTDFERMAQKSALHRLRKRLPITDEDALQNLRDLEEATDIELGATPQAPAAAEPAGATAQAPVSGGPSSPPPAAEADGRKLRTPRKSRVLEGLKANGSKTETPPPPAATPAQTEYSEDDIV